ncbi:MAG: DUF624 domain-containing protein [Butyrivibrio sp.]|nr:DUF624 domain-containing protein [Butyrivibrio sp.]
MKFLDIDSPFMRVLSRIADLMILNLLTLLFLIIPFTGGASLTAMHYVLLKMVRDEDSYIVRGFWKSFKENLKQATILWIIVLVVAGIIGMDYYLLLFSQGSFPFFYRYILIAMTVLLYMVFLYIFPLQSKFVNPIRQTLKNSLLIAFLGLPRTIGMVVVTLIPWVLLYFFDFRVMMILMLFGLTAPGYVCALLYNKLFARFEPEPEPELSEEEELARAIRKLDEE